MSTPADARSSKVDGASILASQGLLPADDYTLAPSTKAFDDGGKIPVGNLRSGWRLPQDHREGTVRRWARQPGIGSGRSTGARARGDLIALDAHAGQLDVLLTDTEMSSRRSELKAEPLKPPVRGYAALYVERVLQADQGCDFDFLVGRSQCPADEPDAIFDGWVGGW